MSENARFDLAQRLNSLDDLVNFISALERDRSAGHDPMGT
jgi:hypothetical protein